MLVVNRGAAAALMYPGRTEKDLTMQRLIKGLLGVLVSGGLLVLAAPVMADPPAHAKAWGYRGHDAHDERSDHRDHYRDERARYRFDERDHDRYRDNDHYDRYGHRYGDRRCNHDRDYRADRDYRDYRDYRDTRDYRVVQRLPRGYRTVTHRGDRYYYAGGNWYRPYGQRFVIVRPPAELFAKAFPVRTF
jgi:hypothetical protein